ncbi:hypothetical protein [Bradyrhizobium sp. LHD-71]|uniref:hypothetical protein n=1 Tax=Bradyrhizobium sp. LHD-71 TaxID=3072141 RepID=UPI00280EDF54|nr:hypothetical protein [Bradyrhizobium sp. LHD-71]MDQ8726358.1 hypothetical protein [Bradyrhizobium sp. LHD-71]
MLLTVVCFFVVSGLFGVLAGLGHLYGRGVFSGQLVGGSLQIALAVWLFRGSNIARALLAILSFAGAGLFGALVIFFPGEPAAIMLWLALAATSVVMFWVLVFSKRFRAELALNAAKYRDPELAIVSGER